jgi:hypothetical protein
VAGAVHVEEGDAVALLEGVTFYVEHPAANPGEAADGDVAWDERVGHAGESPLLEMHVRAADFAQLHVEHGRVRLKLRLVEFAHFDCCVRLGDEGGSDFGHSARVSVCRLPGKARGRLLNSLTPGHRREARRCYNFRRDGGS